MRTTTTPTRRLAAGFAALAAVLAMAGCGSSEDADAAAEATQADGISISDGWIKAADSGMTAIFGTVENSGDTEAHLISVSSPVSPSMQLHETVEEDGQMVMRERTDGFMIPAGGEHELAPGGDHLMVMDLTGPVEPGDEVEFTLTFDDDSTKTLTVTAKDFTGAEEEYQPGDGDMDHSDMGDMDGDMDQDMDQDMDHDHAESDDS